MPHVAERWAVQGCSRKVLSAASSGHPGFSRKVLSIHALPGWFSTSVEMENGSRKSITGNYCHQ
jgi:hypothetical protein